MLVWRSGRFTVGSTTHCLFENVIFRVTSHKTFATLIPAQVVNVSSAGFPIPTSLASLPEQYSSCQSCYLPSHKYAKYFSSSTMSHRPKTSFPRFKAVLFEHGYASIDAERDIISAAGGELVDAENLPLDDALRLCEDADALLVRRLRITPAIIQRLRRCKIILRYGVGTDNVDVAAATEAGIIVGHVPSYCVDEVSVHAISLLLAC